MKLKCFQVFTVIRALGNVIYLHRNVNIVGIYLSQIQSYLAGCLLRAKLDKGVNASAPAAAAARATCPDNPDYSG